VLLEAITGRREFEGTVEQAAFERLSRDPRVPESLPAAVGVLLRRMTAREPDRRVSLQEVAVELQQFLVDDLLRRRAAELPAGAEQGRTPSRPQSGVLGPDRLVIAMRLVCQAVHTPRSLLVLGGDGQAVVEAHRGWQRTPDIQRIRRPASAEPHMAWARNGGVSSDDVDDAIDEVRAVAAAPLIGTHGELVGTLYAVDSEAREFSVDELGALADIALLLMQAIGLQTAVRRALGRSD
jgi:eukaryotic-like serine/threonine-protein kinase